MTNDPSSNRTSIDSRRDAAPSGGNASRWARGPLIGRTWHTGKSALSARRLAIALPIVLALAFATPAVAHGDSTLAEVRSGSPAVLQLPAAGRESVDPCDENEGFRRLDFWLGDWVVYVGEQQVGTNRIEKILAGCAIMEHWTDVGGNEGKSLFFYNPTTDRWKQVWVTEDATRPGGLKEKGLIDQFEDGGVRFQGEIPLPGGRTYLDRTTLTPMPDGSVEQVIEVSRDGGKRWQVTFDARYVKPEGE